MSLPVSIADFEFVRTLGSGGDSRCFLARTPARLRIPAEFVAVKVYFGPSNDETYRRAVSQLRAFAGARSSELVTLIEAGLDNECLYVVNDYLPLGSLATPSRPIDRRHALRAMADAARGAHALHQSGMTHRGIKPSNVLLTDDGGRLGDPGLTSAINPGRTTSGSDSLSSVEFLDPVLVRGATPTRATDIYALGSTLHRALTGRGILGEVPDTDPVAALRRVLDHQPAIHGRLDAPTAALIETCLQPDPRSRPLTALQLADAIQQLPEVDDR